MVNKCNPLSMNGDPIIFIYSPDVGSYHCTFTLPVIFERSIVIVCIAVQYTTPSFEATVSYAAKV